ncbi:LacI family DNA-binding transcriptional regulator [Pseudolactococcus yaeyamensis]
MAKITIKDIAKEAGVSISTVSNVLNKRNNKASKATIEKINDVVKKYDYSINLNARSMVTHESGMIGVLYYTEKSEVNFSDPFLSDILTGIEYSSKIHKKFILVHGFSDIHDVKSIQQKWRFDGYVVIGAVQAIHDKLTCIIEAPVVFVDTYLDNKSLKVDYPRYYIYNNDFEMSYLATQTLIEHGHHAIAFVSPLLGKQTAGVVHERFSGYIKALEQADISYSNHLFFNEDEVAVAVEKSNNYTAILANSDFLAGELINAWKEYGIADKSIISFDNSFFSEFLEPKLTTIDLAQKEKGKKAVEVLVDNLKSQKQTKQKFYIQGSLIQRDSVKNL